MQLNWQNLKKDLKNIFLCKYYRFKKRLTYPSFILPKNRYVNAIHLDELNTVQRLYILRRSNNVFEETFNVLGDTVMLREDAIEPIDILNMSLNLFGGKFKEKHLQYIPKMKTAAVQRWDGRRIYLSNFLDAYQVSKNFCPIYFDVYNIHKISIPYQQNKSMELNKLLRGLGEKPAEKNGKYEFIAQTEVKHYPTNLNYWHIEFKMKDFKAEEVPRKKAAWIEELSMQTFKNILSVNSYHKAPVSLKPIPKKFYLKSDLFSNES